MNELARLWAVRELERHERRLLQRQAQELRQQFDELGPMIRAARERQQADMRQNGPTGFVMMTDAQRGTAAVAPQRHTEAEASQRIPR